VDETCRADEELSTTRLSLRRPTEDDIDAIFAIHSDPATCVHNPSDALSQRRDAEKLYRAWNDVWERRGYGYWVVRLQDLTRQLGFCGVKPAELAGMEVLNLFYRLDRSTWGRGFATEAATAVVRWSARRGPDLPLIARVRPANVASQVVAMRAGLNRSERLDGPGYDGFDLIFATNLPDELRH
jgi:ribosomal-protein-alanine N-acetyltransferase